MIVLTIPRELYDKIVAHARQDHPDEACGVLAGPAGTDRPERFIAMTNAERSPTFYRFDSGEQFRVWQDMDDNGEEPVVIYHSHTATEAYPSRTDISYASEPEAHYVLVSTRDPEATEFRSYRIVDGVVTEEPVSSETPLPAKDTPLLVSPAPPVIAPPAFTVSTGLATSATTAVVPAYPAGATAAMLPPLPTTSGLG